VGIRDIIESKKQWRAEGKKQWQAHMARVKALPPDYQIVYKEIQRYLLFKVRLSGIVDFFEEGVAAGKGVLELIGNDVAAFCDDLVSGSRTCAGTRQEPVSGEPGTAEK
jgi:DNA-binding ferritin-like protein (Dps family)